MLRVFFLSFIFSSLAFGSGRIDSRLCASLLTDANILLGSSTGAIKTGLELVTDLYEWAGRPVLDASSTKAPDVSRTIHWTHAAEEADLLEDLGLFRVLSLPQRRAIGRRLRLVEADLASKSPGPTFTATGDEAVLEMTNRLLTNAAPSQETKDDLGWGPHLPLTLAAGITGIIASTLGAQFYLLPLLDETTTAIGEGAELLKASCVGVTSAGGLSALAGYFCSKYLGKNNFHTFLSDVKTATENQQSAILYFGGSIQDPNPNGTEDLRLDAFSFVPGATRERVLVIHITRTGEHWLLRRLVF